MSDRSFAQTSVIPRQHAHIGGVFAWHNTPQTHPSIAPIRLAGVHRPRVPVSSSPSPSEWSSLDCEGKAASFSSELLVLWSIPALLRTAYRESAQGRNGCFLSRHYRYICCSRLTQKNLIALQWQRIAMCEESRTNTQSQVFLLLPQTLLSTRKGSLCRPPGLLGESFTSRTRSEVCPGVVCKAPISSDCNLAELASPVPVRFSLCDFSHFPLSKGLVGRQKMIWGWRSPLRQDPPPWFECLVIFCLFAPWYRKNREASSVKTASKIKRKSWSNVPPKLLACIGFLNKVVH